MTPPREPVVSIVLVGVLMVALLVALDATGVGVGP